MLRLIWLVMIDDKLLLQVHDCLLFGVLLLLWHLNELKKSLGLLGSSFWFFIRSFKLFDCSVIKKIKVFHSLITNVIKMMAGAFNKLLKVVARSNGGLRNLMNLHLKLILCFCQFFTKFCCGGCGTTGFLQWFFQLIHLLFTLVELLVKFSHFLFLCFNLLAFLLDRFPEKKK